MTERQLRELPGYQDSDAFSEAQRTALRLADALTATPADVPEALFDELRRHFTDDQLVELAAAIAWENHRARFNRTFEVGSEDFAEGAFCPMPVRES